MQTILDSDYYSVFLFDQPLSKCMLVEVQYIQYLILKMMVVERPFCIQDEVDIQGLCLIVCVQ